MTVAGYHLENVMRAGGKNGPPQAEILLAVFMDNYVPAMTGAGDPFVVAHDAPCVMIPLKGKGGLRQRLAAGMWELTGKQPSSEAQSTVIGTVEGLAGQSPHRPRAAIRASRAGQDAFLDLGRPDGLAAVIRPGGWELSSRVPVLWKRTALTAPLPVPAGPGSISGARHLFNIPGDGAWAVTVACRVSALLHPRSTHPVELFDSDTSGSLKTATVRNAKRWTDPGPGIPMPRDSRSWSVTASAGYQLLIDNVSVIPAWWSDLICKGSSGDSWADRALYTDGDVAAWDFSVVPLIDGIGLVGLRADLADRAVRHRLARPRYYLGDDEAEDAWQAEHPAALAWLLGLAAEVSRLQAGGLVPRPRTGRMAVFEWTLAAVDAILGNGGAGTRWWRENRRETAADAIGADQLAAVIAERVRVPSRLTAGELLPWLPERDEQGLPWSAQKAGVRLPRAVDALSKEGWHLERAGAGRAGSRPWAFWPPGTWERRADGAIGYPAALNGGGTPEGRLAAVIAMLDAGVAEQDAAAVVLAANMPPGAGPDPAAEPWCRRLVASASAARQAMVNVEGNSHPARELLRQLSPPQFRVGVRVPLVNVAGPVVGESGECCSYV